MLKQPIAGILDQIEYLLKTSFPTVVWVWYDRGLMLAAKFGQPPQLAPVGRRAVLLGKRKIVPIHGEQ